MYVIQLVDGHTLSSRTDVLFGKKHLLMFGFEEIVFVSISEFIRSLKEYDFIFYVTILVDGTIKK